MQVAQSEMVCATDDDGVHVRDIHTVLDDARAHQNIVVVVDEIRQNLLHLLRWHLAVGHYDTGLRNEFLQLVRHHVQRRHAVVDIEDLSVTPELQLDGFFQYILVGRRDDLGLNRITVQWRSGHHTQIAGPEQRELQGPRDRCRCQRQGVHVDFQRTQFLFRRHAKLLFLVDDEQSQVLELDALAHQLVRADDHVYLALGQVSEDGLRLFGGLGAAQVFHPHGELLETLLERVVMLQRKNCRRYEHGHLFAVGRGLERGAHGYLRLAETHITADQPVHRTRTLHVMFHVRRGLGLIRRVLIQERCLQLLLHVCVGRVGETLFFAARGIECDQVARDVFHLLLRALLQPFPLTAAQLRDSRLRAFFAFVFGYLVQTVHAHKDHVAAAVGQFDHLLRLAVDARTH